MRALTCSPGLRIDGIADGWWYKQEARLGADTCDASTSSMAGARLYLLEFLKSLSFELLSQSLLVHNKHRRVCCDTSCSHAASYAYKAALVA